MFRDKLINVRNKVEDIIDYLKKENKQVVLYGAGYCGYETLKLMRDNNISVIAVCDDFRIGEYIDNILISNIKDIPRQDDTIIFITSGFNEKMKSRLKNLDLLKYYINIDFGRYNPEKEKYSYFTDHETEIEKAYELLNDLKSKQLFINLINYRISRDLNYLNEAMEITPQYFPTEKELDLRVNDDMGGGGIYS